LVSSCLVQFLFFCCIFTALLILKGFANIVNILSIYQVLDNKFSNIKERILYLVEFYKDTRESFFEKIGMTYGNFKGEAKKTPINSNALVNILSIYSEVNPEWLLTGDGPMLRKDMHPVAVPVPDGSSLGIPLIPTHAMAGYMSGEVQVLEFEAERYIIPLFKDAEFLIPVRGSSMQPKFNSGDIVACKRLSLKDIFFQWNKVYVIDTDQGVIVKRIRKGSDPELISIVSDNKDYEPFELHLSQIRSIAVVIGVIRLE